MWPTHACDCIIFFMYIIKSNIWFLVQFGKTYTREFFWSSVKKLTRACFPKLHSNHTITNKQRLNWLHFKFRHKLNEEPEYESYTTNRCVNVPKVSCNRIRWQTNIYHAEWECEHGNKSAWFLYKLVRMWARQ
jgi:hypothetical protein